jgi:hypothetical protein
MIATLREFDWNYELAMYAGTGACALTVIAVVGGLILGVRYLFSSDRNRRSSAP